MKYEAKNGGSNTPVSTASGTPWVSISQTNAITYSKNLGSNYQLITDEQWLTIAHNVLNQPENWNTNQVGNGYIYSGHNDNSPANALAASANDNDGYSGTGNSGTSNQKRTLRLSNNQVIWDLAGNVHEWTQGAITGTQPGPTGATEYAYRNYNSFPETSLGNANPNILPSYGTPQAISWNNTNGIGQLYSDPSQTALRSFYRGGSWSAGSRAGVFRLSLYNSPSTAYASLGFRASWEL